jgi:hypothetical protein
VVEPVRYIRIPKQKTIEIDIDILQTGSVHNTVYVVGLVSKHDFSVRGLFIVAAFSESLDDGWS